MNMFPRKDVAEFSSTKFSDSPLGKMSETKVFDKAASEYDKPLCLSNENLKNCPIENSKGNWDGARGNSTWNPDPDSIPGKANPDQKAWADILGKYEIGGVVFRDGNPDFTEISKGEVEISPFTDSRSDNFDKADIELANEKGCSPEDVSTWRKESGYTWHECKDMKTMQKVSSEVHNNIPHRGGISEVKKGSGE